MILKEKYEKYQKVLELSQLVDSYAKKNGHAPQRKTFIDIGGDINFIENEYGRYYIFLEDLGYKKRTERKEFLVYDDRNQLVFEGTISEIAEGIFEGEKRQAIKDAITHKRKFRNKYMIIRKETNTNE